MRARLFVMRDETLRTTFGVRRKGLAAQAGIRFQQLNKYESGLGIPPAEMLVKLADALGVTVDFLAAGNPVEDSPLASSRLSRRFKVLGALTADDQETVIKVIDAMIAKERMASALTPVDASA